MACRDEAEAVLHGEAGADLEQRLPVALAQFVEDRPPCRVGERLEDVTHSPRIGKSPLAYPDSVM